MFSAIYIAFGAGWSVKIDDNLTNNILLAKFKKYEKRRGGQYFS